QPVEERSVLDRSLGRLEVPAEARERDAARDVAGVLAPGAVGDREEPEVRADEDPVLVVVPATDVLLAVRLGFERGGLGGRARCRGHSGPIPAALWAPSRVRCC